MATEKYIFISPSSIQTTLTIISDNATISRHLLRLSVFYTYQLRVSLLELVLTKPFSSDNGSHIQHDIYHQAIHAHHRL